MTADGSADVRAFQRAVLSGRIKVRPSLLLRHAISESSIRYDGPGNPALDKRNSKSRIDVLQAAVIAAGLAEQVRKPGGGQGYTSYESPSSRSAAAAGAGVVPGEAGREGSRGLAVRALRQSDRPGSTSRRGTRQGRRPVALDNLQVLCREHHLSVHVDPQRRRWRAFVGELMV